MNPTRLSLSPPETPAVPRKARWRFILLLLAVLCAAGYLRMERTKNGLPYTHHPDEYHVVGRAITILKSGDWNPHWFDYGSFLIYLHTGVAAVHFIHLRGLPPDRPESVQSLSEVASPFDKGQRRAFSHPSFIFSSRMFTAIAGTGVVALTWFLGRELFSSFAGLLAAALISIQPLHVEHSAYAAPNILVGLTSLLAVIAAVRFYAGGRPAYLFLSLVFCGLSAATKYNSAVVWITPALALLGRHLEDRDSVRALCWVAVPVLPPLVFLLVVPYAILDLPKFLEDVTRQMAHYFFRGHGPRNSIEPGLPHALVELKHFFANWNVVLAFAALGALGLLPNKRFWIACSYPLTLVCLMIGTTVDFHRNLLPTYPFVAVAGAIGIVMAFRRLTGRAPRSVRAASIGVLALLFAVCFGVTHSKASATRRPETRSRSITEINRLAQERGWRRVGIATELDLHPLDLLRLRIPCRIDQVASLARQPDDLDAIVTAGEYTTLPGALESSRNWVEQLNAVTVGMETIAFVPGSGMELTTVSRNPAVKIVLP